MDDENLESSEVLTENNNDQDLQIEEEINIQPDEANDTETLDEADQVDNVEDANDGGNKPKSKKDYAFEKLKKQKKALKQEVRDLKKEIENFKKAGDPMAKYNKDQYTPQQWRDLQIRENVKAEMQQQELVKKQRDLDSQESELYSEEFELKKQDFMKKAPDYEKVMKEAENLYIPDEAMEFLQESDQSLEMAYFLAKNPEKAEDLQDMSQNKMMRYLSRLENRLENQSEAKTSKAKATPKRRGAGASTQSLAEASMNDYVKARRKQLSGKVTGNR